MREGGSSEKQDVSALADFDTGEVLDAMSSGIVVLDEQLCAVYANPNAETLIMMGLEQLRGRPFTDFLREPRLLTKALQQALDGEETVCDCDLALASERPRMERRRARVRVSLLPKQVTRNYLLLQLEPCIDFALTCG